MGLLASKDDRSNFDKDKYTPRRRLGKFRDAGLQIYSLRVEDIHYAGGFGTTFVKERKRT